MFRWLDWPGNGFKTFCSLSVLEKPLIYDPVSYHPEKRIGYEGHVCQFQATIRPNFIDLYRSSGS